jgi:putative DNA primase/helicase
MNDFNLADELEKQDTGLERAVKAIAGLPILQREIERKRLAKEYDVRKSTIDQYIKEFTKKEESGGTADVVTEVEPFEGEVDGAMLLDTISKEISKYVILPNGAREPIAAWCVLTYAYDAFRILPILGIVSPTKRCGKTTLLETLQGLVNKSLIASNISPPAVFRTIHKYNPTLLIDEADTFLKDNNELRGVLNSGHTKNSAYVVRLVGDNHETMKFSTWGPKAVSMIGTLPDTLQDRAIVIKLKRKAPGERAVKLSIDFEDECLELRRKCQRWADDNLERLSMTSPDVPKTNNDRMTDNWMPLFAIAEVAGGDWPELIKSSMMKMLDVSEDEISQMLLEDIQEIFNSNVAERMFSDDLVEALKEKSERPWCDWNRGKGLTQNGLARLLKPFGVKSKTMRIDENLKKGYELDNLRDAFKRYIFTLPTEPPISIVTTLQTNNNKNLDEKQNVTDNNSVTDEIQHNLLNPYDCYDVTDKNPISEGKEKVFNEQTGLWTDV